MIMRRSNRRVLTVRVRKAVEGWKGEIIVWPSLIWTLPREWRHSDRYRMGTIRLHPDRHNLAFTIDGHDLVLFDFVPGRDGHPLG